MQPSHSQDIRAPHRQAVNCCYCSACLQKSNPLNAALPGDDCCPAVQCHPASALCRYPTSPCSAAWVHIPWDMSDALWSSWSRDWERGLSAEGLGVGTSIPGFVPASLAVDGSCALCCWEGGGWHEANRSPLMKPTQLIRVLSGLCTTRPSRWFGHNSLLMPHALATGHRRATLTSLCSVAGADPNEANGLRRVSGVWFLLIMT